MSALAAVGAVVLAMLVSFLQFGLHKVPEGAVGVYYRCALRPILSPPRPWAIATRPMTSIGHGFAVCEKQSHLSCKVTGHREEEGHHDHAHRQGSFHLTFSFLRWPVEVL